MAKIWKIDLYYCIIILFSKYCTSDDYTCFPKTECLCEFNNHNELDISSVKASFRRVNITYTFNGCNFASDLAGCEHAKLCKYNTSAKRGESLGDNLTFIEFQGQPGAHNISLNFKNNTANITSTITLVCTSGLNYTIFTDVPGSNDNSFYLFSPSACVVVRHTTGGLSTGSVLLLLLFLGCVFYFVGGAIVLHCIRGARGKEMIPNIDFWQNLPGLVKDGLIFALNGCRPTAVTTADSYDRI